MNKFLCLFIIFAMLTPYAPALAEDTAILPVLNCTYDTYIENSNPKDTSSNEDSPIIFAGDVYNRTVFMEFDISTGVPENAKGRSSLSVFQR